MILLTHSFWDVVQWQMNIPCIGCASTCGLQTAVTGTISDASGPAPYSNNASCAWIIAPVDAAMITLNFTQFQTAANDYVLVYQCTSSSCSQQQQIAELSGTYLRAQTVISTTGVMKVVFSSDDSTTSDGFSASWLMVSDISCNYKIMVSHISCSYIQTNSCAAAVSLVFFFGEESRNPLI